MTSKYTFIDFFLIEIRGVSRTQSIKYRIFKGLFTKIFCHAIQKKIPSAIRDSYGFSHFIAAVRPDGQYFFE